MKLTDMNRKLILSIWLACFFCAGLSVHAQPVSVRSLPEPPPIPAKENRISFPRGDSAFNPFFTKLDRLIFEGAEEVNIVHMGGSHVQAGMLTDAIRFHLQAMAPGLTGDRGFFFPFSLARTNNPSTYRVWTNDIESWNGERCSVPSHEGPWGVSGIRAWTRNKDAKVRIHSTAEPFHFRHVRIFAAPSDSSFGVAFGNAPDTVWYNPDLQACEALYSSPQDTLSFSLYQSAPTQSYFSLEGIQVLDQPVGLRYHALGANGAATHSFLKCERFRDQLQAFPPDVVIFGLGINDAYKPTGQFDSTAYEQNYDTLMSWVRDVNPSAAFIFLTNNDSYYRGSHNPHGEVVKRCMERLATHNGAAIHDFYSLMGGARSISYWIRQGWAARDGIHMTNAGYAIQADWLAEALVNWYLQRYQQLFEDSQTAILQEL